MHLGNHKLAKLEDIAGSVSFRSVAAWCDLQKPAYSFWRLSAVSRSLGRSLLENDPVGPRSLLQFILILTHNR
jgi:hypothetical protein